MAAPPGSRKIVELAAARADAGESTKRGGPSIAVLPLSNLSGDPEQRYLSDGITDDIITELSSFRDIFVIGRSSSFACEPFAGDVKRVARELGVQYVLEGSVRRAGDRLRISVGLVDGASGERIWADRYDGELKDVLDLQAEIARRIVGSIAPEIHFAEQQRIERAAPANPAAYDLALRASALIGRGIAAEDRAPIREGIELAQRAVTLDPQCLRAHYALAWGYCRLGVMGHFNAAAQDDLAAADAAAERLRELDGRNHAAYAILGHVAMRRMRHDESLANLRQAHELNPNDVTTLRWLSWEESNFGMAEEAARHAELSLRLSPRDRTTDVGYWALGLAAWVAGDLPRCLENARRAVTLNRDFAGHYILLAACLADMGRDDEAQEAVAAIRRLAPGLIESRLEGRTHFTKPALAERYLGALRRAAGMAPKPAAAASSLAGLTGREREVLRLVAQGLSNSRIAAKLDLSEHTVKRHVANILTKLDLPTRAAASAFAAREGLL
ncbi:MAG: LuxR C-terminal-related transcriptional regulator [Acidobacteriota bacterium]